MSQVKPSSTPDSRGAGGPSAEWDWLMKQFEITARDTPATLQDKMMLMLRVIQEVQQTLRFQLTLTTLWMKQWKEQYAHSAEQRQLAEDCTRACNEWMESYDKLQECCLKGSKDPITICPCLFEGMISVLAGVEGWARQLQSIAAQSNDPPVREIAVESAASLSKVARIGSAVAAHDLSWLKCIRRKFTSVTDLQEAFAHHLRLHQLQEELPAATIESRSPGKMQAGRMTITYHFGDDPGRGEYLQLAMAYADKHTTNWRFYADGDVEQLPPYICRLCGDRVDKPGSLCGECAADSLVYLAYGPGRWDAKYDAKSGAGRSGVSGQSAPP